MRVAIAIALTSLSVPALAKPVLVQGVGDTKEEARTDAFKTATDRYCGNNLLNDRAYDQDTITKNNITVYSSCRVKSSKLLNEVVYDRAYQKYKLTYEIELERTEEADRLFVRTNDEHKFDSNNVTMQIESYNREKIDGDKYLENFMSDFPYKAFEIVPAKKKGFLEVEKKPKFITTEYRNVFLVVPYAFRWSDKYVRSLRNTLDKFALKKKWYQENSDLWNSNTRTIEIHNTNNYNSTVHVLSDVMKFNYITSYMDSHYPAIKVSVYDQRNKLIVEVCTDAVTSIGEPGEPMYGRSGTTYHIGTNREGPHMRYLSLNVRTYNIAPDEVDRVSLDIVKESDCKNYKPSYEYKYY